MSRNGVFLSAPVVVVTLGVLLVCYVVTGGLANVSGSLQLADAWTLRSDAVLRGEVWRLVTYGLVHDLTNPMHLVFNGLMLWFFGRDLEMRLGSLQFLLFLAASVVIGGLVVVLSAVMGFGAGRVVGISAGVEACVVAWALFNRHARVMLFFALPMRGIHMLTVAVVMWVLDVVSLSQNSAAAHLGGMLTGLAGWFLFSRRNRVRLFFDELAIRLRLRRGPRLTVVPKNDRWVN